MSDDTPPAGSADQSADPTFETLAYAEGDGPRRVRRRTTAFAVGTGFIVAAAAVNWRFAWDPDPIDLLFYVALWAVVVYVGVPLATRPRLTARYWAHVRASTAATLAFGYLTAFVVVALVGPTVVGPPETPAFAEATLRQRLPNQPPVWATVPRQNWVCLAETAAGDCAGTWTYPLGTTENGYDVVSLLVHGANVALKVMVITGTLMVPIGVAVGAVAGYADGRLDEVLMRYVDVQQVLPAFLVVLVLVFIYDGSLLLLVLVFGFLDWGGIARMVRSETLQTREEGFVRAARSAGTSPLRIVRRHVVPNTSSTVVTVLTYQLPLVVITEATLAFLFSGVSGPHYWQAFTSWGFTISMGFLAGWTYGWWAFLFPAIPLLATVVSVSVFGDAIRDALDPKTQP